MVRGNRCAMCGKEAVVSNEHDSNNKSDKNQKQQELKDSNVVIEQIDGTYYTFDTEDCALMFKSSVLYMEAILRMNNVNNNLQPLFTLHSHMVYLSEPYPFLTNLQCLSNYW